MKHVGDITKLHGWELEPVDCITGGSPCQDLSLAGKRAGLAGELREKEQRKRAAKRNLPYFDTPRDDNQRLLNYQHDWLTFGDSRAWQNLWELARKVARRMIRAQARRKGFTLDRLDEDDRVDTAVYYVLRRYQDGWYVRKAYLRALKDGVVHALWYRTKADEIQDSVGDEQLAQVRTEDRYLFTEDAPVMVQVDGMTRADVEARIRAECLPEIADMILERINIISGKRR